MTGAILDEGRGETRDQTSEDYHEKRVTYRREKLDPRKGRRRWFWVVSAILILSTIIVPTGVILSNQKRSGGSGSRSSDNESVDGGESAPLNSCRDEDIPAGDRGTYIDASIWIDSRDFNCIYTADTVGNLSTIGLFSNWDDTVKANDIVPALDKTWEYSRRLIRGISLGSWLVIKPFITPSLFDYPASARVVNKYTLTQKLSSATAHTLKHHYTTFISREDVVNIRAAGFDHIRILFPYWAVATYDGDPYVTHTSWRYLLRAIK